jgi:hypothetical protein
MFWQLLHWLQVQFIVFYNLYFHDKKIIPIYEGLSPYKKKLYDEYNRLIDVYIFERDYIKVKINEDKINDKIEKKKKDIYINSLNNILYIYDYGSKKECKYVNFTIAPEFKEGITDPIITKLRLPKIVNNKIKLYYESKFNIVNKKIYKELNVLKKKNNWNVEIVNIFGDIRILLPN